MNTVNVIIQLTRWKEAWKTEHSVNVQISAFIPCRQYISVSNIKIPFDYKVLKILECEDHKGKT